MQIKLFTIPISDDSSGQMELNKFLMSHKILETDQYFYPTEKGAAWCFCVRYINTSTFNTGNAAFDKKLDYKEVLDEKQFSIFSLLRQIRKELAAKDAVPAYAVFTDSELAEICKLPDITVVEMLKLKGIAVKRMEKYGNSLISMYNTLNADKKDITD